MVGQQRREGPSVACEPLFDRAEQFRAVAEELAAPRGLTVANLARMSAWLDGPAWQLLAEQQHTLRQLAGHHDG